MNLRNKLAFFIALNSYVELITRGTSPLSLPSAVANSLQYVKAFGGTEQRNLPDGYTQLEYIESTGTQYIDTGVYASSDNLEIYLKTQADSDFTKEQDIISNYGDGMPSSTKGRGVIGYYQNYIFAYARNSSTTEQNSIVTPTNINDILDIYVNYDYNNSIKTLKVNGVANTTSYTQGVSTNSYTFDLFHQKSASSISFFKGKMYYCKIIIDGILAFNGVPAKDAGGVVGMYDTVSGQFFTNQGTGTFVAGPEAIPTPDTPMDIVSNNGVLKVRQNLWKGNYTDLGYLDETGAVIPTDGYMASDFIEIDQSKKYTFYEQIVQTYTGNGMRICFYNSSKQMVGQRQGDSAINVGAYAYIATPPANAKYIRVSTGVNTNYVTNITLVEGEYNTTTIQGAVGSIYTDGTVETIEDTIGNTATAEMLLKVGDYQDVQSIIDGAVTRKVGVKVLDGTENWGYAATQLRYNLSVSGGQKAASAYDLFCTHYAVRSSANYDTSTNFSSTGTKLYISDRQYDGDITAFKQYLADQYAAGTPVIVVYPLAEPTTESVTGQTLQVQAGDNTLEITQTSLSGLELEAKYKKRK